MRLISPSNRLFVKYRIQENNKETINVSHYWYFVTSGLPTQKANNAASVGGILRVRENYGMHFVQIIFVKVGGKNERARV